MEHHHRLHYIRISLDAKFHVKQTILSSWAKITHKGYVWSKTEQVNITIDFSKFELVQMPNFILNRQF